MTGPSARGDEGVSEPDGRTVEASDFKASRRIWQEETHSGPDPCADPALWIGGTDTEGEPGER